MHLIFRAAIETLVPKFDALIAMRPATCLQDIPMGLRKKGGVYLFSEGDRHLYVGRTGRLRERYSDHTRPSSDMNLAPFAMLLARENTGMGRAYSGENIRANLAVHAVFAPAFIAAKERVSEMAFRYVVEEDDLTQTLLECYVAVALTTPHNDFGNR